MTYSKIMLASASLFGALAFFLIAAPEVIFLLFGLPGSDDATVMSNRAAALFVGLAALSWFGRSVRTNEAKVLTLKSLIATMGSLIAVGVFHAVTKQVGFGVAVALVGEGLFLMAYLNCLKSAKDGRSV
ncbi:hypothetical protein [Pontivivens insulae]|uniref:DUF4345 domain-containing protein n=1 Tax=Pontivivens insulae TaxID=1639689 RepID=A0A2R8A7R2_9RHOB|nr:hypothetical protein [Pontivivens insulae]RED18173.1 hypothetical protein DFR53_0367 [Pontivivens insulae]SPF28070.1 hypothetical protein POI8812_00368 [Pontivivens insulae]